MIRLIGFNIFQKNKGSKILKMFDTSFSQITKSNYRNFIKETILDQCHFFNIVINKYGQPNLSKLKFTKDTLNGANIAVLLLMNKKDSGLSVEESSLVIFFYPDNFFNYKSNQFLNFSIQKKFIRPKQSILIQQIDQKGRKNSP